MTAQNIRPAWITGAGGLIGSWLVKTAPAGRLIKGLTRADLELTDFEKVARNFRADPPCLIIHCAAMSRSTDCQTDPVRARKVNVEVTARIAELAAGIPFAFFSTDLVFDGRAGNYDEFAAVNPLSVYAETKATAEQAVLKNPRHLVIRTSLNSGPSPDGNRGFDEQIRCAWEQRRCLRLFTDEFRSPIPAEVTARAVWELLGLNCTGIFHVAGSERISRHRIGQVLAASWPGLEPRFEPASIAEWKGDPRSPDTSLNCHKAQCLLSFRLPRWTEWLATWQLEPVQKT